VDVEQPVGKALNRDISRGEQIETDLDNLIDRRDKMRRLKEGERLEEEAWVESTRIHNEKRHQQIRREWCQHHMTQAERLRNTLVALIEHHEEQASKLGGDAA
jgi:hypothetical protein